MHLSKAVVNPGIYSGRKPQMPHTIPHGTIILSILFCSSRNRWDRTAVPNPRMIGDTDDDTTNCPVCTEFYEECGDHLPLLLPCSHTLCHSCAVKLAKNGKLECPQDRHVHYGKGGDQMFPQNKYIMKNLEKKLITKDQFLPLTLPFLTTWEIVLIINAVVSHCNCIYMLCDASKLITNWVKRISFIFLSPKLKKNVPLKTITLNKNAFQ